MKHLVLLGWFFVIQGFGGLGSPQTFATIGPFDNEQKCNEERDRLAPAGKDSRKAHPCWYYGGVYEPKPVPR